MKIDIQDDYLLVFGIIGLGTIDHGHYWIR